MRRKGQYKEELTLAPRLHVRPLIHCDKSYYRSTSFSGSLSSALYVGGIGERAWERGWLRCPKASQKLFNSKRTWSGRVYSTDYVNLPKRLTVLAELRAHSHTSWGRCPEFFPQCPGNRSGFLKSSRASRFPIKSPNPQKKCVLTKQALLELSSPDRTANCHVEVMDVQWCL